MPLTSAAIFQSEDELDQLELEPIKPEPEKPRLFKRQVTDELPAVPQKVAQEPAENSESEMFKCILTSILESEAIYLEALSVMLQYMKAMKVTLSTNQPFIPIEDFEVIFYKVPDLHELHLTFYESLKKLVEINGRDHNQVGHCFKMLASRNKIYVAYLNNYQKALEALHRYNLTYFHVISVLLVIFHIDL